VGDCSRVADTWNQISTGSRAEITAQPSAVGRSASDRCDYKSNRLTAVHGFLDTSSPDSTTIPSPFVAIFICRARSDIPYRGTHGSRRNPFPEQRQRDHVFGLKAHVAREPFRVRLQNGSSTPFGCEFSSFPGKRCAHSNSITKGCLRLQFERLGERQ